MAVVADPQAVLDAIKDSEDMSLAADLMSPTDPDLESLVGEVRPLEARRT